MSRMQPLTRRLSSRRSSVSASDPHGTHAPHHPVHASSTLTIVRVISPPPHPDPTPTPSSPRRIHHRRLPSHPPSAPDRVSFAVSSFGPPSRSADPPSPSPRVRPSSPHGHRPPDSHRLSANLPSVPHLSPDQLVDLARSSTHQRALPAAGYAEPASPQLRASSPIGHHHQTTAPATFTPLPDDILLPFIDRPSEVAALISTPPSAKLFSLLEKTLAPITEPSSDPSKWTYTQLHDHLTQVSRQQASDAIWVLQARRCIISHSELIWERVKGALGVPPELDIDYDPSESFPPDSYEYDYASSHGSIDTDELSDDHGRSARGHWEDWDAIMDSPVYARGHSGPSSPVLPLSLARQEDDRFHPEASREAAISPSSFFSPDHRPVSPSTLLSIEPLLAPSPSSQPISPSSYSAPETGGLGLDDIQEGAEEEDESTATSTTDETPTEKEPEFEEPHDPHLIAPSQIQGLRISTAPIDLSVSSSIPPSTLPISSSLSSALSPSASASSTLPKPLSPISPLPPYNYPVNPSAPRSRPTSGTFVRPPLEVGGPLPVFRRSGSAGSLMSLRGAHRDEGDHDGYASSSAASDGGAGAGYERALGSPLFPSNFARLSVEPTLGHGHGHGHGESVSVGKKQRTYSHGAGGGSVSGYKRVSWGAVPAAAQQTTGQ